MKAQSVTTPTLDATINWDTPEAYDTPRLRRTAPTTFGSATREATYLSGGQDLSLSIPGATTIAAASSAVDGRSSAAARRPAPRRCRPLLGGGNNRDEAIIKEVTVPTGAADAVTFDALWNEEQGWDFGFVQVLDGHPAARNQSVACTDTTTEPRPGRAPDCGAEVPGFTGLPGRVEARRPAASRPTPGQTVLLAFRTFNDPAALGRGDGLSAGFWVDNVVLGGDLRSTTGRR